jgi:hypothetical protein
MYKVDFLFTSFAIEETKDGRKVGASFRRQVTEEPDKENCRIIKTNEVYHNVFLHQRTSTAFGRKMLKME